MTQTTDVYSAYTERQRVEKLYHDEKYRGNNEVDQRGQLHAATRRFWDLIGRPCGLTILDFGCGNGWLSILMAKRGNRVCGFDISGVLVDRAKQSAEAANVADRVSFREMPAETLDFPDESFDMIIGTSILHHTDLDVTLCGIRRVLKATGSAIFLEPLNVNILLRLWRASTPWRRSATERALTGADLALIRELFPSTRFSYHCFTSMVTEGLLMVRPRSALLRYIHERLERFDAFVSNTFPALGPYAAVVVMELRK